LAKKQTDEIGHISLNCCIFHPNAIKKLKRYDIILSLNIMNKIIRLFFILSYYNFKLDWQGVHAVVMASAIIHYSEIRTIINMVHYARYFAC